MVSHHSPHWLPTLPVPKGPESYTSCNTVNSVGLALSVAQLLKQEKRPIIVISATFKSLHTIQEALEAFIPQQKLRHFPDNETLPYDHFSPQATITANRLNILSQLARLKETVLTVSLQSVMQRICPTQYIHQHTISMAVGDKMHLDHQKTILANAAYQHVDLVTAPGEFAVRGSLIDIYPMSAKHPVRIELFDNEIESLRIFNQDTQRSIEKIDTISILPANIFPIAEKDISLFKNKWHQYFPANSSKKSSIYEAITHNAIPQGVEYFLPLFFDTPLANFFDYIPENAIVITDGDMHDNANEYITSIKERYEQYRHDLTHPILKPQEIFLTVEETFKALKAFPNIKITNKQKQTILQAVPDILSNIQLKQPAQKLLDYLSLKEPKHVLFCCDAISRKPVLEKLLKSADIEAHEIDSIDQFPLKNTKFHIIIAPINHSIELTNQNIVILSERDLLGHAPKQKTNKGSQQQSEFVIRNLAELNIDDPVVHITHGIGKYLGIESITTDGLTNEFIKVAYANDAKLYIPISELNLISRYNAPTDGAIPYSQLGNSKWNNAKKKAYKKIHDVAAQLLRIHSEKQLKKGFQYKVETKEYEQFSQQFEFVLTQDQEKAINDTQEDMLRPQPMDRLICGDVGFGKTEVAMSTAFIALQNKKQIAVLVPTTLLAQQHYETFYERFASWPVNIALISRLQAAKTIKETKEKLKKHEIDILIGTHKLLQSGISENFADLGLIIIDEEHRFGVKQKEQLRSMKSNIDILSMTATPIPRTLHMAISGLSEISIISTPPAKRLAIKTFVIEKRKHTIKDAINRELARAGQIFYIHNEVKSIEQAAYDLQKLIPEARIAIGHGQMHKHTLEKVMLDFQRYETDILVCTTIIETGIDIPNANTIIIENSQKFGLSQLHQLRGRVGRSDRQAYAYLLIPNLKGLAKDAKKRLDAIESTHDLGAGYALATHDLEIRGAGEILGEEQSGHMQQIGFSLYMELLSQTLQAMQKGQSLDPNTLQEQYVQINLSLPAIIPNDYLPDVYQRLVLYKRIANASKEKELEQIEREIADRFGKLPESTLLLLEQTKLKLIAEKLNIKRIDFYQQSGKIEFPTDSSVDVTKLIQLLQKNPQILELKNTTLHIKHKKPPNIERIQYIKELLHCLQ